MKFINTSSGLFVALNWITKKSNKRQIELIVIASHIKFITYELRAVHNRVYTLRKKLIGK